MHHKYHLTVDNGCPGSNSKQKLTNFWTVVIENYICIYCMFTRKENSQSLSSFSAFTSRPYLYFFTGAKSKIIFPLHLHIYNFHPGSVSLVSASPYCWDLKMQFPIGLLQRLCSYPSMLPLSPLSSAPSTLASFYITLNYKTAFTIFFQSCLVNSAHDWMLLCVQTSISILFSRLTSRLARFSYYFSPNHFWGSSGPPHSEDSLAMLDYLCA